MSVQAPPPGFARQERAPELMKPTKETYERFQQAYEHFNRTLFDGTLPNALITLQRRRRTLGYFARARFSDDAGCAADEIALNPAHFAYRVLPDILSTLVHEMVHLWQHHHGIPGRGRYHNREWAEKMKAIGLQPTDNGMDGGQETGEAIVHLIVPGSAFAKAADRLLERGFMLRWKDVPAAGRAVAAPDHGHPKSGRRVRYSRPTCGLTAWARHEACLMCAEHAALMEPAT